VNSYKNDDARLLYEISTIEPENSGGQLGLSDQSDD